MAAALALTGIGTAAATMSLAAPASAAVAEVRIGQPTLYTDDIDAMSRFYTALGLTEEFRFPETDTQFATMRKGSFYVALVTYAAMREQSGINRLGRGGTFRSDVTIFTSDVDGLYAAALAAGGRSMLAPKDQTFGERQAFVLDPSGNLVGISTENGGGGTG